MSLKSRRVNHGSGAVTIEWTLSHPASEAWRHLTQPSHLQEWLGEPTAFDTSVGGDIVIDHGSGYLCRSIVRAVDPTAMRFTITCTFEDEPTSLVDATLEDASEETCILTLRHHELADLTPSYAVGWLTHLTYLDASLAGTPLPREQFWNLNTTLAALHGGGR